MPQITINTNIDEETQIAIKKKSKWICPFKPIGKISFGNPNTMDALQEIAKFTKSELSLLAFVDTHLKPDNTLYIKRAVLTKSQKTQFRTAIPSWIRKNLLKRIKQEHYLVNPYFIIPAKDFQQSTIENWEDL